MYTHILYYYIIYLYTIYPLKCTNGKLLLIAIIRYNKLFEVGIFFQGKFNT